jgi:hypothetical protein
MNLTLTLGNKQTRSVVPTAMPYSSAVLGQMYGKLRSPLLELEPAQQSPPRKLVPQRITFDRGARPMVSELMGRAPMQQSPQRSLPGLRTEPIMQMTSGTRRETLTAPITLALRMTSGNCQKNAVGFRLLIDGLLIQAWQLLHKLGEICSLPSGAGNKRFWTYWPVREGTTLGRLPAREPMIHVTHVSYNNETAWLSRLAVPGSRAHHINLVPCLEQPVLYLRPALSRKLSSKVEGTLVDTVTWARKLGAVT